MLSRKTRFTIVLLLIIIMLFSILMAGCSKDTSKDTTTGKTSNNTNEQSVTDSSENKTEDGKKEDKPAEPYKLSIMAPGASDEYDSNPIRQQIYAKIEEYTNTEIEFIFYPDTMYWEKVPLVISTGDLPTIMVVNRTPDIANLAFNGDIWEVGPYIKNYPNLSQITEVAWENCSFNGKLYSIPRSRPVGRNGVGYRLDWLENVGLPEPKTINDFYNMLVAFTRNDPDRNGKDDTIGMAVTSYPGPWDNMQIWFGAPNGWGERDGKLVPAHLTEEYDEALRFFRKLYAEGLVNQDFDTYDPAKWDELLRGGIAGCAVDVVDRFARNQEYFDREGIPAKTMIVGGFEGPYGLRLLPTSGYNGMFIISKAKAKTEEELLRVLDFIDKMSDAEMLNLIEWGFEGVHWYYDQELGYAVRYTVEEKPEIDHTRDGLNQITSYYIHPSQEANRIKGAPLNEIRTLADKVQRENEKYCVPNYGASYYSETMATQGTALDEIINTARIKYIKGEIDDAGLLAAKEQWLKAGGQQVIDEMNELYQKSKSGK